MVWTPVSLLETPGINQSRTLPEVLRPSKARTSPQRRRRGAQSTEVGLMKIYLQLTRVYLSKHQDEAVAVALVNDAGRLLKLSGPHSSLTFPFCPILPLVSALPGPSSPSAGHLNSSSCHIHLPSPISGPSTTSLPGPDGP